jgi:hypothetical protein
MKPRPSAHTKEFAPLILWRDDIEKIVAILAQDGKDVEILASESSFENVAELAEHFGVIRPLTDLRIAGMTPYAALSLSQFDARLLVSADDNGSGVFFELNKLLSSRQRRWPFFYSQPFLWMLVVLNFILPKLALLAFGSNNGTYPALALTAAMISWMVWSLFINLRRHAVVRLTRHSESTSFFHRKKDELALVIISVVLGAVIGIVGTRVTDRIFKADGSNGQVVAPAQK